MMLSGMLDAVFLNLSTLWHSYQKIIMAFSWKLFISIVLLFLAIFLARFLHRLIRNAGHTLNRLDKTLLPILANTVVTAVYVIAGVVILDLFGVNTNSIIALLGAAGLAIALALQNTLQNIAASIMLIVLRPFRVDDYIEYGDVGGVVEEMNLFSTVLKTSDGLYVSSPNSQIWGSTIRNYSRNRSRRITINVTLEYAGNVDHALRLLMAITQQDARVLQTPAPEVSVIALSEIGVSLQLRVWTKTADYWTVLWALQRTIKLGLDEAGLHVALNRDFRTEKK